MRGEDRATVQWIFGDLGAWVVAAVAGFLVGAAIALPGWISLQAGGLLLRWATGRHSRLHSVSLETETGFEPVEPMDAPQVVRQTDDVEAVIVPAILLAARPDADCAHARSTGAEAAITFQAMASKVSPAQLKEATVESLGRPPENERQEVGNWTRQSGGETFANGRDDPKSLANASLQLTSSSGGQSSGGGVPGRLLSGLLDGGESGGSGGSLDDLLDELLDSASGGDRKGGTDFGGFFGGGNAPSKKNVRERQASRLLDASLVAMACSPGCSGTRSATRYPAEPGCHTRR